MNGGNCRMAAAAVWTETQRGLCSQKTKPSASAPASAAAIPSAGLVIPQILTLTGIGSTNIPRCASQDNFVSPTAAWAGSIFLRAIDSDSRRLTANESDGANPNDESGTKTLNGLNR